MLCTPHGGSRERFSTYIILKSRDDTLILGDGKSTTFEPLRNKTFFWMKRLLTLQSTLLIMMLLGITSSWAQVSFTIDAPTPVSVGDRFHVKFTVDSEPERNSFEGPDFEGFDVLAGPSTAVGHSIQFINGKQTSSYSCTYTYVLLPREEGKFKIGSASIKVDGKTYKTKPLPIEVIAGGGNTKGSAPESQITKENIMLRWVVSDTEVYKGEAVRASLMLYYNVSLADCSNLDIGTFDKFWSQDLAIPNPASRTEYNGRIYDTYKFYDYLLIPQSDGTLLLPEASATAVAVVYSQSASRDIFFGGREIYEVPRLVKTEPTAIKVKPFPAGAPASFKGAVGSFTMTSTLPTEAININSADEVSITITGSGNFKFFTAPILSLPKSFELYETKIEESIQNSNNGMSGRVTYSYPFVARAVGDYDVAPMEFTFFDPAIGEYKTLSTEPIKLTVINDGSLPQSTVSNNGTTIMGYGNHKEYKRDIRYIKTEDMPEGSSSMLLFSPTYWTIVVILVALFVATFIVMRQRIRANRNVVMRRMKRADKVAIQRLKIAHQYMDKGERHAFYEEILRAMWGYISDKFNIPVSNLTKETIREELTSRGMSMEEAEQFCTIISRADEAQYAPSTNGDMNEVYSDAVDVISKIEAVINRKSTMRTSHNGVVVLIASSIALLGSTTHAMAGESSAESIWHKANEAYDNEEYDTAIEGYNALLKQGHKNEFLYFNLGNAYFKRGMANGNAEGKGFNRGELGRAILNYERALKIDPGMEDARYNLDMAYELTDAPEPLPVNFMTSVWRGMYGITSSNVWCIISLVALFASLALVLAYLLVSNRKARIATFFTSILTALIFILTTSLAISQRSAQEDNSRAVIICNDTEAIHSEPSNKSAVIRTHSQGVVVTILGTNRDWTEVRFADGEKGWIKSNAIERI